MIKAEQLSYNIGSKYLLQDISFVAEAGQFVAIIGANGAGKSTLLKLLSKELSPSKGNIWFNQRQLQEYAIDELARSRAVLSQHNTLSISFRVDELVMMGRYPYFQQRASEEDREIVRKVMSETGIANFAHRDYNTLSGGEQQRVQLARVMAQIYGQAHAVLFLDEPTNGLDLLYQQQVLQSASAYAKRGHIVIAILHDINFAAQYADQILMLKAGKQVAYGSVQDVLKPDLLKEVFSIDISLLRTADYPYPIVVPILNHKKNN